MSESVKRAAAAPEEITKKDVTKAYLRWHFANEIPHSVKLGWWSYYWFNGFYGIRTCKRRI